MGPLVTNVSTLAHELFTARANRAPIAVAPSARDGGLDLDTAYGIEAELVQLRRASGRRTVGRKVGFANKAMWRVLKLQTLVWAHMYDDTVKYADEGNATLSIRQMVSARIEPEVVFKLKATPTPGDAAATLDAVEWVALGFEIVDCPFPDWKFQPVDFVASFGLHAGLASRRPARRHPACRSWNGARRACQPLRRAISLSTLPPALCSRTSNCTWRCS